MSRIMVTLVTGFLGSGKTTLLNALLKHPEMSDAAVIVNEFGEIGIDCDLVQRSDENVVQLENGCLCCTVKGDLIDTFRDLHLMRQGGTVPKFDRVVIETTGIADPGPVLQIILTDPMVSSCYALDGVVTTVDAVNARSTLDRFAESVRQVAMADRIVLTKSDLVDGNDRDSQLDGIRERLGALNPGASLIESAAGDIEPSDMFGAGIFDVETRQVDLKNWLKVSGEQGKPVDPGPESRDEAGEKDSEVQAYYDSYGHQPEEGHVHDPLIKSFCFTREDPVSLDTLRLFFDALAREAGPNLLRVKGIVNVTDRPGRPAVIQGAQLVFQSLDWLQEWPSDDQRTRIVFITRGIDETYIEDTFDLIKRIAERTAAAAAPV